MQEMCVQSQSQKDPHKKEMTIHFNVLAWENLMERGPDGYRLWGHKRVRYDLVTKQQQQQNNFNSLHINALIISNYYEFIKVPIT